MGNITKVKHFSADARANPPSPHEPYLPASISPNDILYSTFQRKYALPKFRFCFAAAAACLLYVVARYLYVGVNSAFQFDDRFLVKEAAVSCAALCFFLVGLQFLGQARKSKAWLQAVRRNRDLQTIRVTQLYRRIRPQPTLFPIAPETTARQLHQFRRKLPTPVRTIAHHQLENELAKIELSEHLREPTPIASDQSIPPAAAIFLAFFMTVLALGAWASRAPLFVAIFSITALALITSIRPLQLKLRAILNLNLNLNAIITAPGIIVDHKNQRWTVNDSIMLLNTDASKTIFVTFINSQQRIQLRFRKLDHPDFITLWQNWNHPNPRPELLT